jgi:hypothetical protein
LTKGRRPDKRSAALPAKRLSPLKKCGSCRRKSDNVFAGAETGVILVSSVGGGSKRRRPSEARPRRGRQRFAGQVVEIAASAVKQRLDEP